MCLFSPKKRKFQRAKIPRGGFGRAPPLRGRGGRSGGASLRARSTGRTRDDDVCVSRAPAPTSRRESTQTRANECARERREKVRRARGPVPPSRRPAFSQPRPGRAEPQICRQRSRLENPADARSRPARVGIQRRARLDRARGPRARDARATRPGGAVRLSRRAGPRRRPPVGARAVFRHRRRARRRHRRRRPIPDPARTDPNASSQSPHAPSPLLRAPVSPRPSPPASRSVPRHTLVYDKERIFQGALGRKEEGEPRRNRYLGR